MATQICPKCKEDSFTWSIDEEESPLTYWHCYNCLYGAYEDEKLECICENCGIKTKSRLKDESTEYWWCSSCNTITP
jgi:hypothetical protein